MSNRHPEGANSPLARRARLLRKAIMGDYQGASAAFAAHIGVSAQRWSNVETGLPLSRQVAEKLSEKIPGFSSDWLRHDNRQGLSVGLWQKIEAAAERERGSSAENANTGR